MLEYYHDVVAMQLFCYKKKMAVFCNISIQFGVKISDYNYNWENFTSCVIFKERMYH